MQLPELTRRAVEVRARFAAAETARGGSPWTRAVLADAHGIDLESAFVKTMAELEAKLPPAAAT